MAVLIIGALIVVCVIIFAGKSKNVPADTDADTWQTEDLDSAEDEQGIIDLDSEGAVTDPEPTEPPISAVDQVNVDKLIDRYYDAKIKDDAAELNNIVDTDKPYNEADLVDETQFISRYDNFRTYVIPGITDNYFVVYVKYDIYFNGINTGAPSMNRYIVVKDEDGYYYIYDKEVSGEFQSYLEQTEQSEIVTELKAQVESELKAACDSNKDLELLISLLKDEKDEGDSQTDVRDYDGGSTEAEDTETSPEEDSESFETQEFTEDGNS